MKVIAITGRSGSGKSTVSAYYGSLGYPVLDADRTAREVTRPGGPRLCTVVRCIRFGHPSARRHAGPGCLAPGLCHRRARGG